MSEPRSGKPQRIEPRAQDGFPMIVTAPWVSVGPTDAVKGDLIRVNAGTRASFLFWDRARDA